MATKELVTRFCLRVSNSVNSLLHAVSARLCKVVARRMILIQSFSDALECRAIANMNSSLSFVRTILLRSVFNVLTGRLWNVMRSGQRT